MIDHLRRSGMLLSTTTQKYRFRLNAVKTIRPGIIRFCVWIAKGEAQLSGRLVAAALSFVYNDLSECH
jgi:hypothetical protein